ncbi:sister chromatid separation inhibitor, securin [Schizosaccharomyces osmophilus]|uniref:Sister chromatid separation inhibitor, securin n=1 Tax=Schizosaccharomyces osmophilus TaxID=2545709 RepID=A0AAE9WAI8_9SCHI|nr:sister chromatid separation inhibitor, securin [Schizosaccharomyces osmophilus]WBW72403.1 sister chromatid separation inhibitor, securin [Schizosaccharomyces osmophilus]
MFSYGKENTVPVTPVPQKHDGRLEEAKNASLTSKKTANGTPTGRTASRTILGGKSTNIRKTHSVGDDVFTPSLIPSAPSLFKPSPMDISMDSLSSLQTPSSTKDDSMIHESPDRKGNAEQTFFNQDTQQDTTTQHHISIDDGEADDLEYMPPTASLDPLANLGLEDVSIDFRQLGKCWTADLAPPGQTAVGEQRSVRPPVSKSSSLNRSPAFRVFEETPSSKNGSNAAAVEKPNEEDNDERLENIELPLLDLDSGAPLTERNPNIVSRAANVDTSKKPAVAPIPKTQPLKSRIRKPTSGSFSTTRKPLRRPLVNSRGLHSRLSRTPSETLSSSTRRHPTALKIDCSSLDADLL